jgi:hypothetical protein
VVALIAVGAAGYYAQQARQDKTDYSMSAPKKAHVNAGSNTSSKQAVEPETADAAAIKAQRILTMYLKSNQYDRDFVDAHVSDGFFTSSFKAQLDSKTQTVGADHLLCGQDIKPDSFDIYSKNIKATTANVSLYKVVKGVNDSIVSTVLEYKNGVWSINAVNCPS